jgi:hypothetical protein
VPTFCRHNRFFADCPICSKGTVLDPKRQEARRPRASRPARGTARKSTAAAARPARGPYASAGPYDGAEVRLERVPGGLRLAMWRGGQIERTAPVVAAQDLPRLLGEAAEKELLPAADLPADALAAGASPGRSGELSDELRVEPVGDGRVRIARWILRPNRGWELQEAPVMLPPDRFTEALRAAVASGGPAQ